MANEADILGTEMKQDCVHPARGGPPYSMFNKPKRKRGFHRAVKRGETWAVVEKMMIDASSRLERAYFGWDK